MDYQIVNLVASANLNATLDLYNLAVSVPNIEYEPEQFPGAILKLREPKVSMLLFKNGKVICSGASSEEQISLGIKKASKLIHEIQPNVKILEKVSYSVVNIVATGNLHQTLDLFKTAVSLDNVEYEPEQFPGAILRINDPKITLLLFKNGKVICAGAKNEALLREGLVRAQKMIKEIKAGKPLTKEEMVEEQKAAPIFVPTKPKEQKAKTTRKAAPAAKKSKTPAKAKKARAPKPKSAKKPKKSAKSKAVKKKAAVKKKRR